MCLLNFNKGKIQILLAEKMEWARITWIIKIKNHSIKWEEDIIWMLLFLSIYSAITLYYLQKIIYYLHYINGVLSYERLL